MSRNHDPLHDITVQLIHETDKAWLLNDGAKENVWVPKSWGELDNNPDGTYTLTMPESKCKEKGFI